MQRYEKSREMPKIFEHFRDGVSLKPKIRKRLYRKSNFRGLTQNDRKYKARQRIVRNQGMEEES